MNCEYCNLENYTKFEFSNEAYCCLAEAPYTALDMIHDSKTGKYGLSASGDFVTSIEINFCPFCGRKLKEE